MSGAEISSGALSLEAQHVGASCNAGASHRLAAVICRRRHAACAAAHLFHRYVNVCVFVVCVRCVRVRVRVHTYHLNYDQVPFEFYYIQHQI